MIVASKFGVRVGNGKTVYDNSPAWIREALHSSLKRLGTDYLDLYQVHYRDGITPISAVVDTLDELQQQGHIKYYGMSNIHQADLPELMPYSGKFVSFQDEYSLACRKNEADMIAISEAMKMTPLTWGSLGQGVLTGKYNKDSKFESNDRRSRDVYVNFHGEKFLKNLEIVEVMKDIAQHHDRSIASIAIRFILDYLPGSVVLCGAKRPSQIMGNVESMGWHLNEYEINRLNEISCE